MSPKKDTTYQHAEIILDIMIEKSGMTQNGFSKQVLGVGGANISSARKSKKIPNRWFEIFEKEYRIGKEALIQQAKNGYNAAHPHAQGHIAPMMSFDPGITPGAKLTDREKYIQDMNGLFSIIMRWQEEENGADPLTSMQFIQLFHERIPELGEWIKKQKGGGAENSPSENLSVAGGKP